MRAWREKLQFKGLSTLMWQSAITEDPILAQLIGNFLEKLINGDYGSHKCTDSLYSSGGKKRICLGYA